MNRTTTVIPTVIFVLMCSFLTIAEAQTVNAQALSPKQQGIVTISAFTANGDQGKAENSPE